MTTLAAISLWDVICALGALTILFSIGVLGLFVWEVFGGW